MTHYLHAFNQISLAFIVSKHIHSKLSYSFLLLSWDLFVVLCISKSHKTSCRFHSKQYKIIKLVINYRTVWKSRHWKLNYFSHFSQFKTKVGLNAVMQKCNSSLCHKIWLHLVNAEISNSSKLILENLYSFLPTFLIFELGTSDSGSCQCNLEKHLSCV